MKSDLDKIRNKLQSKDKQQKLQFLSNLSPADQKLLLQYPDLFLFDKQIINDTDANGNYWMYYLLRCGRGFGKTHAGTAWIAKKIREGAKIVGICGPTYDDVAKIMVPAILKWFLTTELEETPYNHQTHTIRFKNGAIIHCYTSDKEIKGPNLSYLLCDEVATWCDSIPEKIKERFEDITRSVRVGKHPQTVITSTPKTHPFFIDFEDKVLSGDTNYMMLQGSILDNITLPKAYVDAQIKNFGDTARGRQELFGDLIRDSLGAYWTHKLIDECRSELPIVSPRIPAIPSNAVLMGYEPAPVKPEGKPIYLIRKTLGFDPSVSKGGDECGIIITSLYSNNIAYVEHDQSGHYSPDEWSKLINQLYKQYSVSCVVVEKNNGGNTFEYIMRSVNATMKIVPIHATQGKATRAEHTSALYAQNRVRHVGTFKQLEDQMCSFNINYSKSPDRLDALNLAITELFWPTATQSSNQIKNLPIRFR